MKKFLVLFIFVIVLLVSCQPAPEPTIEEKIVGHWGAVVGNFDYILHFRSDNWALFMKVHNEEVFETEVYQWFIEDGLFVMVDERRFPEVSNFSYDGDTFTLGTITYTRID